MNSIIYLSPHYDDAVLSCGGLIRRQASDSSVKVMTVFGAPRNDRTVEDAAALRFLRVAQGIGYRREALYRPGFDPTTVLGNTLDQEGLEHCLGLPDQLEFESLLGHTIYCPLAIGGHIDHILVRRRAALLSLDVRYWEDLPYGFDRPVDPWVRGLTSELIPISPDSQDFDVWMGACDLYSSQITPMFGDAQTMRDQYRNYLTTTGGIRIWRKTQ